MPIEQALITWVHLVAASIWVGGGIFLGAVLAPALRHTGLGVQERMALMIRIGRQFNKIAIPSLIVLIGTGLYSSHRLLMQPELLVSPGYGSVLTAKIILVAAILAVYAVHVRVIRGSVEERVMSSQMPEAELRRLRKKIIILGEAVSVMSVVALLLAAVLDSGA